MKNLKYIFFFLILLIIGLIIIVISYFSSSQIHLSKILYQLELKNTEFDNLVNIKFLAKSVKQSLIHSGKFSFNTPSNPDSQFKLQVKLIVLKGELLISYDLKNNIHKTGFEHFSCYETVVFKDKVQNKKNKLNESINNAINKGIKRLIRIANMKKNNFKKLSLLLNDKDKQIKISAIRMLGEKKNNNSVSDLLKQLSDNDMDIVLASVGALMKIGNEDSVASIADLSFKLPDVYVFQILYAVFEIGGPVAEAYLFTVSTGHKHPEIQKTAKELLSKIKQGDLNEN